jgi:pyruvate kinase
MARIPVIVATQMMETMITSLTPRAEVNVANSVMDGADAVMLSGETATGTILYKVIEKMTQIIKVENSPLIQVPQNTPQIKNKRFITKTICRHAAIMSDAIKAKAICTLTNSGYNFSNICLETISTYILLHQTKESLRN